MERWKGGRRSQLNFFMIPGGRMVAMKSTFEDLEIWRLSRDLRKACSSLTKSLPPDERFRLTDQLVRASRSVTANIAEGYGRFHFQENIQYCRHARGSLFEIIDHFYVALDEGYIHEDLFAKLKAQTHEIIIKINGYIRYLNQQKLISEKTTQRLNDSTTQRLNDSTTQRLNDLTT